MQQESVPKARRNPDCIRGRDFRDQDAAKKGEKTKLPETEREGLNASLVWGKTCRAQKTADDAAYNKKACRKQGAIQTE